MKPTRDASPSTAPPWWPAAVVAAAALVVYLRTCARTVTLVDSGELILACSGLGVAHPPGFPVYTVVGHLFSLLPVGSPAFRIALMSAFFGAALAGLTSLVVGELTARGVEARDRRGAAAVPALAAGGTLAFSLSVWSYAVVAEVYTLTLALLAAVVWLLVRWRRLGGDAAALSRPALLGAGLLYGLALGVHHASVVLAAPALLVFAWSTFGWRDLVRRAALPVAGGVCLGLLSYLYLPWASGRNPVLDWGDPSTLERFWWHVTARQYQTNLFAADLGAVAGRLSELGALLVRQMTPVGLAVAALGVAWLWRHDRRTLGMLALIVGCGVAYAVNYDIAEDWDAYFLTTFLALAIALGAGVRWILERVAGRPAVVRRGAIVASLLLPVLPLVVHFGAADRSRDRIARHYAEDALATVGPGGLLLTMDWQLYAPYLYLSHLEGSRTDAAVVNLNLLRRSWYVDGYLRDTYPDLMASCDAEARAFLVKLRDWEHRRPHDPDELTRLYTALANAMIAARLADGGAHLTLPMAPGVGTGLTWVPHGLAIRLEPPGTPPRPGPEPDLHTAALAAGDDRLPEVARVKVRPYYALMLANRARLLVMSGDLDGAGARVDEALRLDPASSPAHQAAGDLHLARGRRDAARAAYRRALELDPGNRLARRGLTIAGR